MEKPVLENLDHGQLDMMWQMYQLGGIEPSRTDIDVLIKNVDAVRQALIQKTAGQRKGDPGNYIDFKDLGTHINLVILSALALRASGVLERLYEILDEEK